jgi:hypothetical protein
MADIKSTGKKLNKAQQLHRQIEELQAQLEAANNFAQE